MVVGIGQCALTEASEAELIVDVVKVAVGCSPWRWADWYAWNWRVCASVCGEQASADWMMKEATSYLAVQVFSCRHHCSKKKT